MFLVQLHEKGMILLLLMIVIMIILSMMIMCMIMMMKMRYCCSCRVRNIIVERTPCTHYLDVVDCNILLLMLVRWWTRTVDTAVT